MTTEAFQPDSAPRLHVYLASDAPVGVVLRRGPTAWSRLSVWRTETDEVTHGQWMAGRVFERRCDVSPDGTLFGYFVHKASGGPDVNVDSWIAISRPPHFTALALWQIGTTYCSGALFVDATTLRLGGITEPPDIGSLPSWLSLSKDPPPYAASTPEWTSRHVYWNRLLRAGWTPSPSIDAAEPVWERREPAGNRVLMMATARTARWATYGERQALEFALQSGDDLTPLAASGERVTWADWDHRGRLIIARGGRLIESRGDGDERVIADFNGQAPDPQPSPPDARVWPKRSVRS